MGKVSRGQSGERMRRSLLKMGHVTLAHPFWPSYTGLYVDEPRVAV